MVMEYSGSTLHRWVHQILSNHSDYIIISFMHTQENLLPGPPFRGSEMALAWPLSVCSLKPEGPIRSSRLVYYAPHATESHWVGPYEAHRVQPGRNMLVVCAAGRGRASIAAPLTLGTAVESS